ncbi:MAG: lysylphosphatidylglycerol synthase transmembrane domain-containing protein [Bryobacteraceae bacterium]
MSKRHLGAGIAALAALAAVLFVVHRLRTSGFAWKEFAAALTQVDWRWLALSMILVMATYAGRALRWEVMIRPLRADASLWRLLSGTAIGFTAVVLFGRAGEPVRPYLIAKSEGISFSSQIAAWLVERILDLLMILLIFGIALTQIAHSTVQPGPRIRVALQAAGYTAGLTGIACLALLIAMRQFRGRLQQRLLGALSFLPEKAVSRIAGFLASFEDGMQCMRSAGSTVLLFAYSIVEWLVIATAFACVFKAFPATASLGITDVVILLGFVAFGSALQIPGVGGGMQIVTVLVLTEFFGIGLETATGIALVLWIVSFVLIVPIGLALAFSEGIKWRNLRHLDASGTMEAHNGGHNP